MRPDKIIVLKRLDGGVSILQPVRPYHGAVFDPITDVLITPAETEKQYLDDVRDQAIAANKSLTGAVEVARGYPADVLPADKTDRDKWEYDAVAKAVKVNPVRVVPVP